MNVLIGCERYGVIRDAFRSMGHNAWSCDLHMSETFGLGGEGGYHLQGDVRWFIDEPPPCDDGSGVWDLFIVHPDCTYLCSSGLHHNNKVPGRAELTEKALDFVREMMAAPIDRICLENPVGRIGTAIRKADQYVQPYEFGDDASKNTGLWLKNLPTLIKDPEQRVPGRIVTHNGKQVERWANQTDSGQNRLGPSKGRAMERAKTYPGIAEAMSRQWNFWGFLG
ncbi:MAG: hypothetical protein KAR40_08040 [Candidatus Sabulitectum sp.]|nr:hypothetical protein [Candidatus Sabulitectum sp.]